MTVFDTEEKGFINVVSAEEAAFAPRSGFLEAFSQAYDLQAKTWSQFGLELALRNHEQEMFSRIREAGAEPPPSLNDTEDTALLGGSLTLEGLAPGVNSQRYLDTARSLSGEDVDDENLPALLAQRDAKLRALRSKFPNAGIKTYGELFADVKADAVAAEERSERTPLSFGGTLGDFIGGAAGSMRPSSDPLNFATLGVGGAGRSVAARIASEGGAQGAIETINQFTGVQENRKLLGLQYGVSQAAAQIALTAAGGAGLRATGEAAAAGVRRWFRSTNIDPAPTPAEINVPDRAPRSGEQLLLTGPSSPRRTQTVPEGDDLPDVMFAGEGQRPSLNPEVIEAGAPRGPIPPPQRRLAAPLDDIGPIVHREAQRSGLSPLRPLDFGRLISEETQRQVPGTDSRLGRKRFAEDVAAVAEQLEIFGGTRPADVRPSVDAAAAGKLGSAQVKQSGPYMITEKGASISARQADPDAFRLRANIERRLTKVEERIESDVRAARASSDGAKAADAAEAHVRAQNKPFVDRLEHKLRAAQTSVERAEAVSQGRFSRDSAIDAPEAAVRTPEPAPDVRTDASTPQARTATTEIREATEHATKVADEAVDRFRGMVGRLLAEETGEIHLPSGKKLDLDGDTMVVPTKEGEGSRTVTVRQALREMQEDEDILRAVNSCSIPSRS